MNIIFSVFLKFLNIIKPIVNICFKLYYRKLDVRNVLPKCKNEILLLPAYELAKKIRNHEITSEKVVQAYIDRIKEIQPFLNCVVQDCFDEAIKEAKKVDEILAKPLTSEKYSDKNAPFFGVPFSCKECFWVKGKSNNTGLVSRKDFIAPQDATIVENMKNSGAILTCITNTSEACMWLETSNYVTGTTCNPYNFSRISGGSSGGEGCIISACGSICGIGSDIGGSIRMPCFFNGIYGHMPSRYLISNDFQFPPPIGMQEEMLITGPMCRYASDLKHMLKILSGSKYNDIKQNFENYLDFKKLKFYYIKDLQGHQFLNELSNDARNALFKAKSFLEKNFETEVMEIKLNKFQFSFEMWNNKMNSDKSESDWFSYTLNNSETKSLNPYLELFKSIFQFQNQHTFPSIMYAINQRFPLSIPGHHLRLADELKKEINNILNNDGIILFPSFPVAAPYHNQTIFTNPIDFIYFGVWNLFGFPVTQIPMGLNREGLPLGIQLIANNKMDHLTIKLAEYFEKNLIGWIPPFDF